MNCEQFIYTSAETVSKTGYQVIAKSKGVSEKIINEINDYLYPAGMDQSKFKESKSLLLLSDNKIAFSQIINIGIGYDGRDYTIYNHTIITSKKEFKEFRNDSRIFEPFFLKDPFRRKRDLPILILSSLRPSPDFTILKDVNPKVLKEIILGLMKNKKIALLEKNNNIISKILSILPPSLRIISFSTLVINPKLQPRYRFVQTHGSDQITFTSGFILLTLKEIISSQRIDITPITERNVDRLIYLIYNNRILLDSLYEDMEIAPEKDFELKFNLIVTYDLFTSSMNEKDKEKYAHEIIEMLDKLDSQTAISYFEKISEYVKEYDKEKYYSEVRLYPVISQYSFSIDVENINKLLRSVSIRDTQYVLKLLSTQQKNQFLKNGNNLIIDAYLTHSYYKDDIIQFFITNSSFQKCIFDIFDRENKLTRTRLNDLYNHIIELTEIYNPKLIIDLLRHLPLELKLKDDVQQFKRMMKTMMITLLSKNVEPDTLHKIIKSSRKIVENMIKISPKTRNYEINKIIYDIIVILIDTITYLKNNSLDYEILDDLNREEKHLEKFKKGLKPTEGKSSYL